MLQREQAALATVVELLEELLDANMDTVDLVGDAGTDVAWLSHLEYLRALHRHGEAVLAHLP
jgi:hypothetical protein